MILESVNNRRDEIILNIYYINIQYIRLEVIHVNIKHVDVYHIKREVRL
jgi:hypothetical protein